MIDTAMTQKDLLFMIQGAGMTLAVTFWAVLGGTILGLVFGLIRASGPKWISMVVGGILDIFRYVPLLIQLILYNSINSIAKVGFRPFTVACVTLAIYTAAYCTEIVRSGVLSVPQTTRRAARSLGMSWLQDINYIVLPIAIRVVLPSWIGLSLGVMKDTALILWLGIVELLRSSQVIITRLQEPLFVLMVAGIIYFLMSFPIARIGDYLERRWQSQ
jgi:His/Glu/Gln/Arg/opine family amino acid ABC transporter permease subunit